MARNVDKFKSAEEAHAAFINYCNSVWCINCPFYGITNPTLICEVLWCFEDEKKTAAVPKRVELENENART